MALKALQIAVFVATCWSFTLVADDWWHYVKGLPAIVPVGIAMAAVVTAVIYWSRYWYWRLLRRIGKKPHFAQEPHVAHIGHLSAESPAGQQAAGSGIRSDSR